MVDDLFDRLVSASRFLTGPRKAARQFRELGAEQLAKRLWLTPNSEIDPADVLIVGFPKSGNTWFQTLATGVVWQIDARPLPFSLIQDLIPDWGRPYYRRYKTPTYFKSHELPHPNYRRVVHLVRDGRDALVSYFHYQKALRRDYTWQQLIDDGVNLYGHWSHHAEAWLANPYDAELIRIRYEDLQTQPLVELRRFCTFAGIERSDEDLNWAIANASFDNMQRKEKDFPVRPDYPDDQNFIRRGVVGSHLDEMPAHILAQFEAQSRQVLVRLGYQVGAGD